MTNYSYLALGDSYTIGEQVPFADNFPNQTVQLLRKSGFSFHAPEIIAQTGWTTAELLHAINHTGILETYDVVSLLIGVNNQYRGYAAVEFKKTFENLLQQSIRFAGHKPQQVFVLSIPDWGITPFAEGRNRKQIADEIDTYNSICVSSANQFKTNYINITEAQRADGNKPEFLTADGLHPSGKAYEKWAVKLTDAILKERS